MRVVWSAEARSQLHEIVRYVARFDPAAARRLSARIRAIVLPLTDYPSLYREGQVPGTRELIPYPNCRVVYQVGADHVLILSLLHVRRQYP